MVLLVLAAVALVLLLPLRGVVLSFAPPVALLAALVLFVVPGAVTVELLRVGAGFPVNVPFAFASSTGLFGLLALPHLILKWSVTSYLLVCGAVLALSLAALLFLAVCNSDRKNRVEEDASGAERWLWAPFLCLSAVAATISTIDSHVPGSDTWAYLMYAQDFLAADRLNEGISGLSRTTAMGWVLELAALSRISGADPVDIVTTYLEPALIVVALLAFYGLARTLFRNKAAALFSGCLAALLYLLQLNPNSPVPRGEFVGYLTEDKYLAHYVFLPVTLSMAALFLDERRWRHLLLYAFLCGSVLAVHYMGFALIAICVAGFGILHLTANLRDRGAWRSVGLLWSVPLVIGLPPLLYLTTLGRASLPRPGAANPEEAIAYSWFTSQERLLELDSGTYIAHPGLLLNPVMVATYLVAVPYLLWRLRRDGPAAQVPLGILLLLPLLVYVPPVTALIADATFPRLVGRLIWLLPFAAPLALGWTAWRLICYTVARFGSIATGRAVTLLSLVLVIVLAAASASPIWAGVRATDARGEVPQEQSSCTDPTFRWMSGVVEQPSVVIATPNTDSTCLSAYVAHASVLVYRGVISPDAAQATGEPMADLQRFLSAAVVDGEMLEILRRYYAYYVLLPKNSPLNLQLGHLPGIVPLDNPGERYRLYRVDREELPKPADAPPAVEMNGRVNQEEPREALELLGSALEGDEDEQFLARIAAGQARVQTGEFDLAVINYEEAIELFPDSPQAYALLADAHIAAGEERRATEVLEGAVERYPEDDALRDRLAALLVQLRDADRAVEYYRPVVEDHPDVPEYRARLGGFLAAAGDEAAAEREFERAISLNPLSVKTYLDIAAANEGAGRLREAAASYEKALEMEPESQSTSLRLGHAYYQLSVEDEGNGRYPELAEEHLRAAAESRAPEANDELRAQAYFFLGNLHRDRDHPQRAVAAYEKALEANPDLAQARTNAERLRDRGD